MAYISNFIGIFVPNTYFAMTCEVEVAVGYVSVCICKTVGALCPLSMFVT